MKQDWQSMYIKRVKEELEKGRISPQGKKMVTVHVYDLFDIAKSEEPELTKTEFFNRLFFLNRCIDPEIVLYLGNAVPKIRK